MRAGDIDAAKAAFAPSRFHWETIEPIAGLVEQIDGAVDARVDDFANETDPAWTGWHRIEYLLWEQGDVATAVPFADQLDADLATLRDQLAGLELPPTAVALGAAELVEEVSEGKITGEEDRYSHTDLWDFAANIQGARKVNSCSRPLCSSETRTWSPRSRTASSESRMGSSPTATAPGGSPTPSSRMRTALGSRPNWPISRVALHRAGNAWPELMDTTRTPILRRRSLLLGGAAAASVVAGAGCSRARDDEQRASSSPPPTGRGFHGATQTGVATPALAHSLAAASTSWPAIGPSCLMRSAS